MRTSDSQKIWRYEDRIWRTDRCALIRRDATTLACGWADPHNRRGGVCTLTDGPYSQYPVICAPVIWHVLYNLENRDRQFPREPSTDLAIVFWHTVPAGGIELRDGFVAQCPSTRTLRCGQTVVGPTAVDVTVPVPIIADPTIANPTVVDPTIAIPTPVGQPPWCLRLPTTGCSAVRRL